MKNKITIGSRESKLAVLQSEMVRDYIKNHDPELEVEILTMKTTGDKILDRTLDKVGGKGLFVKELDHALLDGRTELSVHSLKDMPMEVPAELPLLAFSKREDPRDVLVLPKGGDRTGQIQTSWLFQPQKNPSASGIVSGYGDKEHKGKPSDKTS